MHCLGFRWGGPPRHRRARAPTSRPAQFGTVEPVSATESTATNGPEAVAAVALDAGAAAAGATAYTGYNPFLGSSTTATAVAPSARGRESGVASVAPTAAAFDSDYASLPDMPSSPLSAPPLGPAALLYDSPHRKSSRSKRRHRAATGVSDTTTPLREPVASTHALPPSWHRQAPLSAPAGAWGFSPAASSPASPSTRSPASVLSPTIRRSLSFQEAYSSSPVRESSSSSSAAAATAFGTPSHRANGGRSSATPRPAPRSARSDREESRSSEVDPAIWRDVLFSNVRDWEDLPRPRSTDSATRGSARTPSRTSNPNARMPREYRLDDDVVEEAEEEIDRSEYRGRRGRRAETARAGTAASKSRRERLEDEERGDDLFDDGSDLDADEWSLVESLRESGSSLLALLGWSSSRTGAEGERGAAERRRGAGGARRTGPTLPTHREPGTPPPAPSSRAAAQRELDGAALTPRPTVRRPTGDSPLGVDASAEIDAVAAVHSPHVRFQVGESPDAVIGLSFTERVAWVRGALSALGSSVSTQAATLTAVLAERGGPALDAFIRLAHRQTARIVALAESGAEPAGEGSLVGLALPRHVQDATRAQADAAHLDSQLDGVAMRAPLATTSP